MSIANEISRIQGGATTIKNWATTKAQISETGELIDVVAEDIKNISIADTTVYSASASADQTVAAGQYLKGAQTIKKVELVADSSNILSGSSVSITSNGAQVASVSGSIPSKAAATITPSSSAQYIESGQYLSGKQTISAVPVDSSNTVTLKDSTGANVIAAAVSSTKDTKSATSGKWFSSVQVPRIVKSTPVSTELAAGGSVTIPAGYYATDGSVSAKTLSEQTPGDATAADILSGKTAWVDGVEVEGTIASKAAATYYTNTSDQKISAKQYLSGDQTIKGVYTSGISAENIKSGTAVKVGDSANNGRIKNITGTFTSSETATSTNGTADAGKIMNGYSAWVDGVEVEGTMAEKAAATYTASTTDQKILAGRYLTGDQTIRAVSLSGNSDDIASKILTGSRVSIVSNNTTVTYIDGTMTDNGELGSTTSPNVISSQNGTYTIPAGYTSGGVVKATINNGAIVSGSATIDNIGVNYNSTNGNYDVTGSKETVPSVTTAGYVSASSGTKTNGTASVSTTLGKVAIKSTNSIKESGKTAVVTPQISKVTKPTADTWVDAASSTATTTKPSSGVYVAVQSGENKATLKSTPTVTTAGYGTTTAGTYSATNGETTVGANASSVTYVPITTTSASVSGNKVTYGTGWITGGSKEIATTTLTASAESTASGSASMSSTTVANTENNAASSYYVSLTTTAGSAKATSGVSGSGYVTSGTTKTGTCSVPVTGNGDKYYIPASTCTVAGGGLSNSSNLKVSTNSSTYGSTYSVTRAAVTDAHTAGYTPAKNASNSINAATLYIKPSNVESNSVVGNTAATAKVTLNPGEQITVPEGYNGGDYIIRASIADASGEAVSSSGYNATISTPALGVGTLTDGNYPVTTTGSTVNFSASTHGWFESGSKVIGTESSPVSLGTLPAASVPNPTISVSSNGLITASSVTSEGYYVPANSTTKKIESTQQLTTKGATTVEATNTEQTIVNAGTYCTGAIKVKAANYYYTSTNAPTTSDGNNGDLWLVI